MGLCFDPFINELLVNERLLLTNAMRCDGQARNTTPSNVHYMHSTHVQYSEEQSEYAK